MVLYSICRIILLSVKILVLGKNIKPSKYTATARVSTMVDVLNEYILSSTITGRKSGEPDLAIDYLEDVKNKINLQKIISISYLIFLYPIFVIIFFCK